MLMPMTLLRSSLQQYTQLDGTEYAQHCAQEKGQNYIIISREKFDAFCASANVTDTQTALEALSDAAIVVPLEGGRLVHLRPALFVEEEEMADQVSRGEAAGHIYDSFLLEEVEARISALEKEEAELRSQLTPAIAKAARWRRSVWGGALCFAGAQLAIISRLTYFDLDWDIMEPVSYTIGIGTALFFYVYYLRHDDEHTYSDFDQRYLPKKVRQYAPRDFDWARYEKVCQQLVDEEKMLANLKEWASKR